MNACVVGWGLMESIADLETHSDCGIGSLPTRILHLSATSCNYRNLSDSKNGVIDEKVERPANGGTCARHKDGYSLIDRCQLLQLGSMLINRGRPDLMG